MRIALLVLVGAVGCSASESSPPAQGDAAPDVASVVDSAVVDSAIASDVASEVDAPVVALPSCLGEPQPIVLGANLPFVSIAVGATKSTGSFLIDFATTAAR